MRTFVHITGLIAFSVAAAWAAAPENDAGNVRVQGGYSLQALARGLDFPTAVAFSNTSTGGVWVAEGGFLPGFAPKVKQIGPNGTVTTILSGTQLPGRFEGPLTDVTFHDGWLWVTHRQLGVNGWLVGAISRFQPANPVGTFQTVITNLPSAGDHYTEEIIFAADVDASRSDRATPTPGRAYFSQGSATNSTVVGADNWFVTMWLQMFPTFHDFTPVPVVLSGINYKTAFPFPLDPTATKITAPYFPFGSGPKPAGTVVPAATPASPQEGIIAGGGTVYSFEPNAANPAATMRLEGWGFRNPYGIGFDPFAADTLFVSNNGADTRSMVVNGQVKVIESRPIGNDWDDMFTLQVGGPAEFFGWPDFFHHPRSRQALPVTDPFFCQQSALTFPCPPPVFAPGFASSLRVQPAFAELTLHSSANKFDFSSTKDFGFVGDIFVAETGAFVPVTGAEQFVGYKVVRVERNNGNDTDFIEHISQSPAVIFLPTGFNKPIDGKFRGPVMVIVDLGVFEPGVQLQQPGTGKVWIVFKDAPGLQ
jgi:hypothetical protein